MLDAGRDVSCASTSGLPRLQRWLELIGAMTQLRASSYSRARVLGNPTVGMKDEQDMNEQERQLTLAEDQADNSRKVPRLYQ